MCDLYPRVPRGHACPRPLEDATCTIQSTHSAPQWPMACCHIGGGIQYLLYCITKFLTSKISHFEKFTYKKTHLCIKKLVSTVGNGRENEGTLGECRKIIKKCYILHRKRTPFMKSCKISATFPDVHRQLTGKACGHSRFPCSTICKMATLKVWW